MSSSSSMKQGGERTPHESKAHEWPTNGTDIPWRGQETAGPTWLSSEERPLASQVLLQRKATVRPAGDSYEREADHVADAVMAAPSAGPGQAPVVGRISSVVQRDAAGAQAGGSAPALSDKVSQQLDAAKGGGSPLDSETQSFMEPRFGQDFSHVRLHTDSRATDMAVQLKARAFTHGSDIFMGAGQSSMSSPDGKHLLAHELTHVVQQGGGDAVQRKPVIQRDPVGGASESDTESAEAAAPAPEAAALGDPELGKSFVGEYHSAIVAIGNDLPRKNIGEVRAAMAALVPQADAVGDPRCRELLGVTEAVLADIFATPPLTFDEALSTAEAAQLLAYAEKSKAGGELDEARGTFSDMKKTVKGAGRFEKLGTKAKMPKARRKIQEALDKCSLANERYISLFEGMVPPNVVVDLIGDLGTRALRERSAAADLYEKVGGDYGAKGSIIFDLANVVQEHVGRSVILVFEAVSGMSFD